MTKEAIERWWKKCHSDPGNNFISDYGGPSLWEAMNITDRVTRRKRILEIGVGDGNDIRQLREMECRVYALDITPTALAKVDGLTEGTWLSPEGLPAQRFHLAISHLVTQHMGNAALERQIRSVLRSLKKGGVFAMQFADHLEGVTDGTYRETFEYQRGGGVCRSLSMMKGIVEACGGLMTWISEPKCFPESRWFYVHIVNT